MASCLVSCGEASVIACWFQANEKHDDLEKLEGVQIFVVKTDHLHIRS